MLYIYIYIYDLDVQIRSRGLELRRRVAVRLEAHGVHHQRRRGLDAAVQGRYHSRGVLVKGGLAIRTCPCAIAKVRFRL